MVKDYTNGNDEKMTDKHKPNDNLLIALQRRNNASYCRSSNVRFSSQGLVLASYLCTHTQISRKIELTLLPKASWKSY